MTRIDFYVLGSDDPRTRLLLVCRLAEKAAGLGQRMFVHGDDDAPLEELDELLWSFRASSFVPHRLLAADEPTERVSADPVQLSRGAPGPDRRVLVNLAREVPPFFSRFERALEVVDQSAALRERGRMRYRWYRQRGYPLKHHDLS